MADSSSHRPYAPTSQRLQRARKEGNLAVSQDLCSAVILLGAFCFFYLFGEYAAQYVKKIYESHFLNVTCVEISHESFSAKITSSVWALSWVAIPFFSVLGILAVTVGMAQTGFFYRPAQVIPDWKRVSPGEGLARLFSWKNFFSLIFGLSKMLVILCVTVGVVYVRRDTVFQLGMVPLPEAVYGAVRLLIICGMLISLILVVLAVLDYFVQYRIWINSLRMTEQEMREELKDLEGNAQIKARQKSVHRNISGS